MSFLTHYLTGRTSQTRLYKDCNFSSQIILGGEEQLSTLPLLKGWGKLGSQSTSDNFSLSSRAIKSVKFCHAGSKGCIYIVFNILFPKMNSFSQSWWPFRTPALCFTKLQLLKKKNDGQIICPPTPHTQA